MPTPRRFAAYPSSYGDIFRKAHRDGAVFIRLASNKAARNLRAHLYAYRAAAMEELPESTGDLLLILPEIRTRIEDATLVLFFDTRNQELANATRDSKTDSGVPVEN